MTGINNTGSTKDKTYDGHAEEIFDEIRNGINKNSPYYKQHLNPYLYALKEAFGTELVFPRLKEPQERYGLIYWAAKQFSVDLKEHTEGKPVKFTSTTGANYNVTPDTIDYAGHKDDFGPKQAMEMAVLAFQDKSMVSKKGVTLTGSDREKTLLTLAIGEINKSLAADDQIKINNGKLIKPTFGETPQAWKAFVKQNANENGDFDFTVDVPYTKKYKAEQEQRQQEQADARKQQQEREHARSEQRQQQQKDKSERARREHTKQRQQSRENTRKQWQSKTETPEEKDMRAAFKEAVEEPAAAKGSSLQFAFNNETIVRMRQAYRTIHEGAEKTESKTLDSVIMRQFTNAANNSKQDGGVRLVVEKLNFIYGDGTYDMDGMLNKYRADKANRDAGPQQKAG